VINPLNAELNPICYLLTLLGAHHFLHVSRIRVKSGIFLHNLEVLYVSKIYVHPAYKKMGMLQIISSYKCVINYW